MIYSLIIVIHIIVCLILIAVILLQAGRGGGLSETFGMDATRTIFGTKVSLFLTRATVVAACLYLLTCLALGIMTSRRGKSLIELQRRKALPATAPSALPEETEQGPVDIEDKPLAEPEKLPAE